MGKNKEKLAKKKGKAIFKKGKKAIKNKLKISKKDAPSYGDYGEPTGNLD